MINPTRSTSAVEQHLLTSGSLLAGGIVVTFVGHPFDTVKVRLQTQDMAKPIYCKHSCLYMLVTHASLLSTHNFVRAAGALDCAKKTVQWEGLTGLYKVRIAMHVCIQSAASLSIKTGLT